MGRQRNNAEWIPLSEIHLSERNVRALQRDIGQIEKLRQDYEAGLPMIPVVLIARDDGGYDVQDGRHRVLAATLAGLQGVDAIIKSNRSQNRNGTARERGSFRGEGDGFVRCRLFSLRPFRPLVVSNFLTPIYLIGVRRGATSYLRSLASDCV